MNQLIEKYLTELSSNQNLSPHTIKAYSIDIRQFTSFLKEIGIVTYKDCKNKHITLFISKQKSYKASTLKRKIVSLKKFFSHLAITNEINENHFKKATTKFRTDKTLPRTIDFNIITSIYDKVYENFEKCLYHTEFYLTEVLIIELLYTTGIRVSELCDIKNQDINLNSSLIFIKGKGRKERIVFINNLELCRLIEMYQKLTYNPYCDYFLRNKNLSKLSPQSVRLRLKRIVKECNIKDTVTPHMFRHTFATSLLEEDINLLYIQDLLGHSSIATTQVYLKINKKKQQALVTLKHPRNKITIFTNKG